MPTAIPMYSRKIFTLRLVIPLIAIAGMSVLTKGSATEMMMYTITSGIAVG
ncbi:MAG: hypothetical protein IK024_05870 [Treponema sp.]|nr:hypothetical protein [Treponema sp.]